MKQQIHINDQGELLLIEAPEKPLEAGEGDINLTMYSQALTSAIEKGIKFRDQEAVIQILLKEKFKGHIERDELKCTLQNLPNSYTAEVEYGDEMGIPNTNYQVAVLTPLKQELKECESSPNGKHKFGEYIEGAYRCCFCGEPGNEAKKESVKKRTFVKEVSDYFNGGDADTAKLYDVAKFMERVFEDSNQQIQSLEEMCKQLHYIITHSRMLPLERTMQEHIEKYTELYNAYKKKEPLN